MTMTPLGQGYRKASGLLQLAFEYHHRKRYGEAAWLYQKVIDIYSKLYSRDTTAVEDARTNLAALTRKIENLELVKPKELQMSDPLLDDDTTGMDATLLPTRLPGAPAPAAETAGSQNSMRRAMGPIHVTVRVENLARSGKPYEKEFLVDTLAIDCLAPASALQQAGVAVEGRDAYQLADGEILEYPYGFALISFMGSKTVTQIIFGPEGAEPILGVAALENAGIGIDPVSGTLKRMAAKPLRKIPRTSAAKRESG